MVQRLVEEVAYRRAKRSRQDERGPEQKDPRHVSPVIRGGKQGKTRREDERSTCVSEARHVAIQSPSAVPRVCENVIAAQ